MEATDMNLGDPDNFVEAVPHQWFAHLRRELPVQWHPDPTGFADGFWSVTRYDDCVNVNRDYEHFSSYRSGALFQDMEEEALEQQRMMMLNMDPPMHTRYRRLVNKGFTPRMIRDLETKVVASTNAIIDGVCERGTADFVEEISAELPLQVIADLMGVPQEDRHLVFDWSNRMIGSEDPEYQRDADAGGQAAMELFAYADELCAKKRLDPHEDLFSVLTQAEIDGDQLSQVELDLFFLLLAVAGNETTRNLISGAMVAFFDHPDQWEKLRADRSLLPSAVEEMLRFVTPVMHFRRTAVADTTIGDQKVAAGDKVVFWHISANRDESVFTDPDAFDIARSPNNHMAFGGGGPHFCLGANLARMEIRVMFDQLLDRLPDIRLDGEVQRLRSNFINGVKHIPVAFTPSAPVGR
ncbi:MAG TPA: cytochrome P450 [Acidimicrobiales bacterium]|nr:cytochrome P450 [Acidimicrobiales bacterium]